MAWQRLSNFEYAGYISDIDAHLLPPNTLSRIENAHVDDGVVKRYSGYREIQTLPVPPFWLLAGGFGTPWVLAAGASSVYSITGNGATNVSSAAIAATTVEPNAWTGTVLHGLGVVNNYAAIPHYWAGSGAVAGLTNWPANTYCKTLRGFKNFLFAGWLRENGTEYPTVVRWSHPADPGAVPSSWDYTDTTKDAGRTTLSETPGEIVDMLSSGETFHIYKEDCIYDVVYIGGVYVFRFTPRHYQFGLMARNCAKSYFGRAFAFGTDDIVVHLGNELKSIASRAIRRRIFNAVNPSYRKRCFTAFDPVNKEILFCVPKNSGYPDYAFTYNPQTEKWGERDLPQVGHLEVGKTTFDAGGTWDNASTTTWDNFNSPWGESIVLDAQLFAAGVGASKLFAINEAETLAGVNITALVERKSIDFPSTDSAGRIMFVSRVRPNIIANAGVTVQVQIGSQMKITEAVNWSPAQDFVVGTTRDLNFRVNGRYLSWRVSATGNAPWQLESLDFDLRAGAMW
jgi:hypothetical protein